MTTYALADATAPALAPGDDPPNLVPNPSAETDVAGYILAVPTVTNLVPNPSFETAVAPWATAGGYGFSAPTTVLANTNGGAVVGTKSLEVVCPAVSGAGTGWFDTTALAAVVGDRFYVEMWVKGAGGLVGTPVQFHFGNPSTGQAATNLRSDGVVGGALQNLPATWTKLYAVVTVTDVTNWIANGVAGFMIRTQSATAGTFYMDGIMVVKVPAGTNSVPYLDGDTPGHGWIGTPHASASSNTATVTNLVTNPNFETGTTGWRGTGTGIAGTSTLSQVAGGAVGTSAMQVVTPATAGAGVAFDLTGTFKAGVTYRGVFRVRSVGGVTLLDGYLQNAAGTDQGTLQRNALTSTWTEYTLTWTPSADRTDAVLRLTVATGTATTFLVDAVGVFASANNAGYFDGSFPGASWSGTAHASTSTRSAAGAANLVPNPGFENSTTGWISGGNGITRTTAEFHDGAASGTVNNPTAADSYGYVDIPVLPGTYSFSCWMKWANIAGAGAGARPYAQVGSGSGSTSGLSAFQRGSGGWTRFTNTVTLTTPGTVRIFLQVGSGGTCTGQAWFDGLVLTPGSSAPATFDGDQPGAWWMGAKGASVSVLPVLTRSTAWAKSGSYSFRATDLSGLGVAYVLGPAFPVVGGQTYSARVDFNATVVQGSGHSVWIAWGGGAGGNSTPAGPSTALGEHSLTTSGAAPGAATTGQVMVQISQFTEIVDLMFDAVIAVKAATVPAYFDGDSDGYEWSGTPHASSSIESDVPIGPLTYSLSDALA